LIKGFADLGDKADLLQEIPQYYTTARYPNAGVRRPSTSFSKVQALRVVEVATYVVERVKKAITRRCG
jgi:HEPN domain-containing protein